MTCGIYMIQNKVNGKIYIGQGVDIERRWKDHKRELKGNRHHNTHLQNSWNINGEDNFEFTIICECDENQLNTFEQYYIFELMSYDPEIGYNKSYGGGGCRATEETRKKLSEARKGENNSFYGKHHTEEARKKMSEFHKCKIISEETKKKISEANKGENNSMYGRRGKLSPNYGKTHSEETRKKISKAQKIAMNKPEVRKKLSENNCRYWKGKTPSEETRKKISEALKGRIVSEETRKKLSEAGKGKTHSEETRKKISEAVKIAMSNTEVRKKISEALKGENNHNYGKHLPEETRKKISEAHKGKIVSEETRKKIRENHANFKGENHPQYGKRGFKCPNSIPVVQLTLEEELVKVYGSAHEAVRSGFDSSSIIKCIKGKYKTHKGYKWMRLDDYKAMKKEGLEK